MKKTIGVKDSEHGCPLGHKCEACNWFVPIYKADEKGDITEIMDCQINNLVTFMSETKNMTLGVQRAVEASRNETVERQDKLIGIVNTAGAAHASLPSQ